MLQKSLCGNNICTAREKEKEITAAERDLTILLALREIEKAEF